MYQPARKAALPPIRGAAAAPSGLQALGASGWKGTANLTFKAASFIVVVAVLFVTFKDYSGAESLAEKTFGGIVAFVSVLLVVKF